MDRYIGKRLDGRYEIKEIGFLKENLDSEKLIMKEI